MQKDNPAKNIKNSKYTTSSGIALLLLLAAKIAGIDTGDLFGIETTEITLAIGTVLSGILHLFSKDPKKK